MANKNPSVKTRFSGKLAETAGRKGAAVSATVRQQRALFRDSFKERMTPERMAKIFDALAEKAEAGDVQAATFLRDTMGEKPTDKIEQTVKDLTFCFEGIEEDFYK